MDQTILDKIIKLLALSESSTFPEEAALAKQRAAAMMAKYEIDQSQLEEQPEYEEDIRETNSRSIVRHDTILYQAVANFNGVAFLVQNGTKRQNARHYFIGRKQDIQSYDYMVNAILNQRWAAWKNHLVRFKNQHYGRSPKQTYRITWMKSFALGVYAMLKELTNITDNNLQEYGLVPVKRHEAAMADYEKDHSVGEGRRSRTRNFNREGYEAGKATHINKGIEAGSKTAAIDY